MRSNYAKKLVAGTLVASMTITASMPLFADELATEIPSAGAAVIVEDYINNSGKETDIEKLLPTEATDSTATSNETTKTENQTEKTQTSNTATSSEDKLFANIAITKVSGGAEDYVNVRKKPTTESKVVGKIYNNSGAKILEKTNNGWYKIVSGNCTGYIKSDFFVTGSSAKSRALDNGYVQAEAKDAIHVRAEASTNSKVVTNVYKNETYTIKKFDKTGEWIKVKIKAGVSGWISAQYANVNINMETAITRKEEKAKIKKEREAAKAAAKAAAEEEARKQAEQQEQQASNDNSQSSSDGTYSNSSNSSSRSNYSNSSSSSSSSSSASSSSSSKKSHSSSSSRSSGSGTGAAIVAYAKQFLGNPYVYGGASLTNGTDCSGFTMSVYAHFGYGLSRSSYTQVNNGRAVSMSSLQPGDLLFYKYGGSTISHVAIYIGGGQIIHASTEETGIIISGMGSPCAARRIIG